MQKVYSLVVLVMIMAGCAARSGRAPTQVDPLLAVGSSWNICFATKTKPDCPEGLFLQSIVVNRSNGTITFRSPITQGSMEADESLVEILDKERRQLRVIVGN